MEAAAQAFEFAAQFRVVVDFAVEYDDGVAVVAHDGLVASCEVDDFQADRAERNQFAFPTACWSGPRWIRDEVARRMRSRPAASSYV